MLVLCSDLSGSVLTGRAMHNNNNTPRSINPTKRVVLGFCLTIRGLLSSVLLKKTAKYFVITLFISTFAAQRCAHLCIPMLIPYGMTS